MERAHSFTETQSCWQATPSRTEQVPCYPPNSFSPALLTRLLGAALIASIFGAIPVHAATYYVDFDSGSDSNSGRARDSAWKRSPGDPATRNIARSAILMPGDIVLFRERVNYRREISVNASGAMNIPILFKGDGWGSKTARFEGADRWEAEWSLAPNENLETRLPEVFMAAEAADWRPKAESPAVDTGTDPSSYLPTNIFPEFDFTVDRSGNRRGTNDAWDRGAYEYGMEPARPR